MESKPPPLVVFDYNHGGRVLLTKSRKLKFAAALLFALMTARLLFPFGLLALLIPAMVYLRGERTLRIGRRYLICGERIVYYANVKSLTFSEKDRSICLRTGVKTQLTLEEKRFRADKRFPAEQTARFAEAVKLMTEQVRHFAPDAILSQKTPLASASENETVEAVETAETVEAREVHDPRSPS